MEEEDEEEYEALDHNAPPPRTSWLPAIVKGALVCGILAVGVYCGEQLYGQDTPLRQILGIATSLQGVKIFKSWVKEDALKLGYADVVYERVLFLGPGRGGKTALVASLLGNPFKDTRSTLGIKLKKLCCLLRMNRQGIYRFDLIDVKDHLHLLIMAATYTVLQNRSFNEAEVPRVHAVRIMSGKQQSQDRHSSEAQAAYDYFLREMKSRPVRQLVGDSVYVDFWDFAGQRPFHCLHDMVFTPERTSYCVVFDASYGLDELYTDVFVDEEGEDIPIDVEDSSRARYFEVIESWLYCAWEAISGSLQVPLYLVGTHADRLQPGELKALKEDLRRRIRGKRYMSNLQLIMIVDNTVSGLSDAREDSEITALRNKLVVAVQSRERQRLPLSWIPFSSILQSVAKAMNVKIMSRDKVADIARIACNNPDVDVDELLKYNQSIGNVIPFENLNGVRARAVTGSVSGYLYDPTLLSAILDTIQIVAGVTSKLIIASIALIHVMAVSMGTATFSLPLCLVADFLATPTTHEILRLFLMRWSAPQLADRAVAEGVCECLIAAADATMFTYMAMHQTYFLTYIGDYTCPNSVVSTSVDDALTTTAMVVTDIRWLMNAAASILSPPPPPWRRSEHFRPQYEMAEMGFLCESLAIHNWKKNPSTKSLAESAELRRSLFLLLASKGVVHDPGVADPHDPRCSLYYVPAIATSQPCSRTQASQQAPLFIVPDAPHPGSASRGQNTGTCGISHAQFSRIVVRCLQHFKPSVERTTLGSEVTMLCDNAYQLSLSHHTTAVRVTVTSDNRNKHSQHCTTVRHFFKRTLKELHKTYEGRSTPVHLSVACLCRLSSECRTHREVGCVKTGCQHFVAIGAASQPMRCGPGIAMVSLLSWQQWIQRVHRRCDLSDVCRLVDSGGHDIELPAPFGTGVEYNPWIDVRYKVHHQRLVETLRPRETRTLAYAKGLLTEALWQQLMAIQQPAEHNETILLEMMKGGAKSLHLFLEVLDGLGYNFVDVRHQLQELLDDASWQVSSSESSSDEEDSVEHAVTGQVASLQFMTNAQRSTRGWRLRDIRDLDLLYEKINAILSSTERGELARRVVVSVRGHAIGYQQHIEDSFRGRDLLRDPNYRDARAIFHFWLTEQSFVHPCVCDLVDMVTSINPDVVPRVKALFGSLLDDESMQVSPANSLSRDQAVDQVNQAGPAGKAATSQGMPIAQQTAREWKLVDIGDVQTVQP